MKNNQNGFSAVELIVVLVVVGLLGTVGWLVWDRQNTKHTTTKVSTSTVGKSVPTKSENTAAAPVTSKKNYVTISEFNVKFSVPESLGNVKYVIEPAASGYVRLSSDKNIGCDGAESLGTLFRDTSSTYPELGGTTNTPVAHVGNYYYYFKTPQNSCSNDSAVAAKQQSDFDTIKLALSAIESN